MPKRPRRQEDIELQDRLRECIRELMRKYSSYYPRKKDFAKAIGLKPPQLNMILDGDRPVTIERLVRIRNEFAVSIDEMVKWGAVAVKKGEIKSRNSG